MNNPVKTRRLILSFGYSSFMPQRAPTQKISPLKTALTPKFFAKIIYPGFLGVFRPQFFSPPFLHPNPMGPSERIGDKEELAWSGGRGRSPYFSRFSPPYTSVGRKFAPVEGLSHDLVCTGSIYHVHFAWQVWHGQLSPRFKFNKLKSFSGVEIDQNHVDKRILGGKGFAVGRLKRHNFCPASVFFVPGKIPSMLEYDSL